MKPAATTLDEVMERLITTLDHRWKKEGVELPEGALTRGFLLAAAEPPASLWEVLSDIVESSDIEKLTGWILEQESRDLRLTPKPWWTENELRWWFKLHVMLYNSSGLIPELQYMAAFFLHRDETLMAFSLDARDRADYFTDTLVDYASHIQIINNECPDCHYSEPGFYTILFPVNWINVSGTFFQWDPNDDLELHDSSSGWGAPWGAQYEDHLWEFAQFLAQASVAGVRINPVGTEGFQWDPHDDLELHDSTEHGWGGRWNGDAGSALRAYGIEDEKLVQYHECRRSPATSWEVLVKWPEFSPGGFRWDPNNDLSLHNAPHEGWGNAVWKGGEQQ